MSNNSPQNEDSTTESANSWSPRNSEYQHTVYEGRRMTYGIESGTDERRKQLAVKRACNECRQQKLRCDVVSEPFSSCSRCRRLRLPCKVDANFKRVEKRRKKNEQIQEEHINQSHSAITVPSMEQPGPVLCDEASLDSGQGVHDVSHTLPTEPILSEIPNLAVNSTEIRWSAMTGTLYIPTSPERRRSARTGSTPSMPPQVLDYVNSISSEYCMPRRLDGIELSGDQVQSLFKQFFTHCHQFLPFLNPFQTPDQYYSSSRLLFWSIISVASRRFSMDLTILSSLSTSVPRLLWTTLQAVPQNHHDVKALCLLCIWPFPMNSSSLDPTFMLSGTMMHLAMQIGLHRPSQIQDFSKFTTALPEEDVQDRITTWIACNIVAQSVSTGYGQPSLTMHEWIPQSVIKAKVSEALASRLRIERFCDRITKALYSNEYSPTLLRTDRSVFGSINLLNQEFHHLEMELSNENISVLYLRCAQLHLRLHAFFGLRISNAADSFLSLYESCRSLISLLLYNEDLLSYLPNYAFQVTFAAGAAILKLLRSPLAEYIDFEAGKALFNSTIAVIRRMSVSNNDLPGRLAEVLAQLWTRNSLVSGGQENQTTPPEDRWQSVQLNLRSRMSMSIVYDSLWEWRKGFNKHVGSGDSPDHNSSDSGNPRSLMFQENGDSTGSLMPLSQDLSLDDFPYDAFYPLNSILEIAGNGHQS